MHIGIILFDFGLLVISVFTHSLIRVALELLFILASLSAVLSKEVSYRKGLCDPQIWWYRWQFCKEAASSIYHNLNIKGLYQIVYIAVLNTFIMTVSSIHVANFLS